MTNFGEREQVVVQGAVLQKKSLVWGEPGVSGTFKKVNSHFHPTPQSWGSRHHIEVAVDRHIKAHLAIFIKGRLARLDKNLCQMQE